jgi:hypothetical protein
MPIQDMFNFVCDCKAAAHFSDDEFEVWGGGGTLPVVRVCITLLSVFTVRVGLKVRVGRYGFHHLSVSSHC